MDAAAGDYFSLADDEGFDDGSAQQEFADENLSPADVLRRIEEFVADYVNNLVTGTLPVLELVSRSKSNSYYRAQEAQANATVALGTTVQRRCMLANQASAAHGYVRVFKVMTTMHQLLRSGCTATQRDVYYKLVQPPLLTGPRDVDSAIQDVVALLRVPRSALGITCASRGAIAGLVHVRDSPTAPWQDCTTVGTAGKAIPGSLAAIDALGLRCTARFLLIVEKDAIFQRLVEDGLFHALPCVLVTAKGMPDLATRALCAKLVGQYPDLLVLGLVDYNPHGAIILRTYKFGSHRMGLECHKYALPGLHWLGLRSGWLVDVDAQHLHPLTSRDLSMLPGLVASLVAVDSGACLGASSGQPSQQAAPLGAVESAADLNGSDSSDKQRNKRKASMRERGCGARWSDDDSSQSDEARVGDAQGVSGGQMQQWVEELEVMKAIGFKADIESLYSVVGYEGLKDMVIEAVTHKQYI